MIVTNKKYFFSICIIIVLFAYLDSYSQTSEKTVISGLVVDAKTGLPIAGVSVSFQRTTVGTITDNIGKYSIETKVQANNISLKLSSISLDEVIVKPGKSAYKNKNNPAVDLIQKVINNKDLNNKKSFDYLEFKQYDKIQFALSNIPEKFKESKLFGKFRFVFDNIDTTKRIGKSILPLFIKETLSD